MNKQTRDRYAAFWECSSLGRPLLFVTAPRPDAEEHPDDKRPRDADELGDWLFNPRRVLPRLARRVKNTYHAAEAFPITFPMTTNLPALQAGFLGGDYRVSPDNGSGWCDPVIDDLDEWCKTAAVDPENIWWTRTLTLLSEAQCLAKEGIIVAHPDTQGGGQILDLLRGTEKLAMDMIDQPEAIQTAMRRIDETWLEYWTAMNAVIGEYQNGHADWLRVYSDRPMVCPECDVSCMISNAMFREFFLPSVRFQCETAERSIHHLDGPGAIRHLDSLLEISSLNGIQWVPGAGAKPMVEWLDLLKKIQDAGKCLHISCPSEQVLAVVSELRPEGLYIRTGCASPDQADKLVQNVSRQFGEQ
ncbi:MAG: hypothetical protein JXA11_09725 [Phycisphaerae bacterium]|nr:hypothetical protein [Phycisphaerae bacterium]